MALDIGEKSGCLEVIADNATSTAEIRELEYQAAEREWKCYKKYIFLDTPFCEYYKLNKKETELFNNHQDMPNTFVKKYLKKHSYGGVPYFSVLKSPNNIEFLSHGRPKDTSESLRQAYKDNQLYIVCCNNCNRKWYTDEISFKCVKWKSCCGAKCLKVGINESEADYSTSLYHFNSDTALTTTYESLSVNNSEFLFGEPVPFRMINNQPAPGGLVINYISDIHLLHHLKHYDNCIDKLISKVTTTLRKSIKMHPAENSFQENAIVIFAGDIASDKDVVKEFYKSFMEKCKDLRINVFAVLGNHEYIGFDTIQDATDYYSDLFNSLNIRFLNNTALSNKDVIIFGGTGFAKYNLNYNAENLQCCNTFSREIEIDETTKYEAAYNKALIAAKKDHKCFIVCSHYPLQDCLKTTDNTAIYFTGHNHRNTYCRNQDLTLYADNQIGYKTNAAIKFKQAYTGLEYNPYFGLTDGLYKTSVADYMQFYRYLGQSCGDGAILYRAIKNDAVLYVVKRKGYYGFFLLNEKGSSKGISIVNGGTTKRVTSIPDMEIVCHNFDEMINAYLSAMIPLRNLQEKISNELKAIGFSGEIHGTIVDVDFYHHINFNPIKNEFEFYYAAVLGEKCSYESFDAMMLDYKPDFLDEKKAVKKYFEYKKSNKSNLLTSLVPNMNTLGLSSGLKTINQIQKGFNVTRKVDLRGEDYTLSRKVSPLQRLFDGHVLRAFDLHIIGQESGTKRTKHYDGYIFCDMRNEKNYLIVKDNGTDYVDVVDVDTYETGQMLIGEIKKAIRNSAHFDGFWLTESWQETREAGYGKLVDKYFEE